MSKNFLLLRLRGWVIKFTVNKSYKLLLISAILVMIAVVTFWQGLKGFDYTQPSKNSVVDESSPSTPSAELEATAEATVANPSSGQVVRVSKVVDGDTIEIVSEGRPFKVRLIGIDTPETVDPRRPVGCFGKEASNESHRLMDNQSVVLVKDISDTDKFGRLLRYVYVVRDNNNWLFINDYLVRNGFAKSSTYPPDVKFQEEFKLAEKEAREAKRGLWGSKCSS